MSLKRNILDLRKRKDEVRKGGGDKAIEKQVAQGKLTARQRILAIVDEGSFHEYDMFVEHVGTDFNMGNKVLAGDGVVIGTGTIYGSPICIYAQDFTVEGGSLGLMHARKITKIMDHALKMRVPLIGINDSGGARIQEGVNSLAGYGEIFFRNTLSSGVIPQISVILGPCAGGAVYSPALTDFVFVVENISKMFITGPAVIKSVLGEDISMEALGGARVHAEITGNAHFFALSEEECFEQIKTLITYIPWNNMQKAKAFPPKEPKTKYKIENIVPADVRMPYDIREIIKSITDDSEFFEIMELFAANIVIGFGRMNGETVGFVANQPLVLAGVLDCDSSDKAARFIRYCNAFNIPIITLEDMPGYLPGVDQEHAGVIRHGAKILYAYSEATVPKITVIIRKAYGGGYIAMNSRHLRADFVFAWPTAEIAVMGPEGAANIVFRKEIAEAADPEAMRQQKIQEYKDKFANPYVAASKGYIDEVIEPQETRKILLHALQISAHKDIQSPAKNTDFHHFKPNKRIMADQEKNQVIIVHSAKYQTTYNKKYLNRKVWEEPNFNLIKSYIPGTIIDILVKEGQVLKGGDSIIVLEAMKMYNDVQMPFNGKIVKINIEKGQKIPKGFVMIEIEPVK